jgi:histone deacetylase complex regulatory component SIN3
MRRDAPSPLAKRGNVFKRLLLVGPQTYSKEQKNSTFGIKEVYDHVARLFKDQPDLLDEFTHFLPDQVLPATEDRGSPPRPIRRLSLGFRMKNAYRSSFEVYGFTVSPHSATLYTARLSWDPPAGARNAS